MSKDTNTNMAIQTKDLNTLNLNGYAKDLSKKSFWHYTSLNNLEKIICGNYQGFFISNFSEMNDLDEAELHESDKKSVYSLCFCNTETEKIPMWFMYSDISGKGVSLGITPKNMLNFIKSIREIYPVINGIPQLNFPLKINTDFDLYCGWIFYQNLFNPNNFYYRKKWYDNIVPTDDFARDNYFIKKYPWHYEDEFRIVIKINKHIDCDKIYVKLPEDIINTVKIKFGPGFYDLKQCQYIEPKNELNNFGITKIQNSQLKINMNLIHRNIDVFIEEISNEILDKKESNIAYSICDKIKKAQMCSKKQGGYNVN